MSDPSSKGNVLIVWVYYEAVGHVVEAIAAAAQYKAANPDLRFSLLLSSKSCSDFVALCPWVEECYLINPDGDCSEQLNRGVPREWDYVIYPKRLNFRPEQYYTPKLLAANSTAKDYFLTRQWSQFQEHHAPGHRNLAYDPLASFQIKLPAREQQWAQEQRDHGKAVVSVLLAGAGPSSSYPSIRSWRKIFEAIRLRNENVEFWITGVSMKRRYGWKSATRFNRELEEFVANETYIKGFIDIGLKRQMALIGESDVFMSPHTGFAFLAPCLGTPWLAVSGGYWGEDFYAGVPFYCSLPRCSRYPCSSQMKDTCRLRSKLRVPVKCMSAFPEARLDGIANAVVELAALSYSFDEAFVRYRDQAIEMGVDFNKLWRIREHFNNRSLDSLPH